MALSLKKKPPSKPIVQSIARLAWLAGVLDADGSLGISLSGRGVYVVQVQITNTDHRLLDRARAIYEGLGLSYRIGRLSNGQKNAKHAHALNLVVGKFSSVLILLDAVGPFMISKFDRAVLLADFCRLRVAANANGRGVNALPYGQREHDLYRQAKEMQRAYKVYGETHVH